MRGFARLALGVLIALGVAACKAVGPDYERPSVETIAHMPEVAATATATPGTVRVDEGAPVVERYWEVFHDRELDKLVQAALDGNQDLQVAMARVLEARSVVRQQFAPLIPSVGLTGAYAYVKLPRLGPGGQAAAAGPFSGQPFQTFAGFANMTYEVDLWGRLRRQLESANAQEVASEEDRKDVEITVVHDVLQTYFDLCEADTDVAIANDSVAIATSSLAIVRERYEKGFGTELDLHRAEALLAQQRAVVPESERARAVAEHKLAILIGRMPTRRFAAKPPAEFDLPPTIPTGVPAQLLERRPDIRAAEARLVASNAGIGAVIGEFFPRLSLFGFYGAAALDLRSISNAANNLFIAGPQLSIPIFGGGETYARLLGARAQTQENEALFRRAVLTAFGEIADAVVALDAHQRVRDELAEQEKALGRSVDLATMQYKTGFTTFLEVLDAQRVLLQVRQSLVHSQREILGDIVRLQRALGGGWHDVEPDEFQQKLVSPVLPR